MTEKRETMNFFEYFTKVLGYELDSFEEGDGYEEEWDLIIQIIYKKRFKKHD